MNIVERAPSPNSPKTYRSHAIATTHLCGRRQLMKPPPDLTVPPAMGELRNMKCYAIGLVGAVIIASACAPGPSEVAIPADLLDRDAFIEALLELRMGALDNAAWKMRVSERDSILSARGLTAEDIEEFVEFHGRDVMFMKDLWEDVDGRLLELLAPPPDSTSSEG